MQLAKTKLGIEINVNNALENEQYICIDCGGNLIAKVKNKTRRKRKIHFAHHGTCTGNLETYLHKVAKTVFENETEIFLPLLGNIRYQKVEVEFRLDRIRPDIIITDIYNQKIIIEILFRHRCDENKINKIKEMNIPAYEIDLSQLNYDADYETIKYEVLKNKENRTVLHSNHKEENEGYGFLIILVLISIISFILSYRSRKKNTYQDYRKYSSI